MIPFSADGILLDIEGTTSSVRFVYDVLFPFAREHVAEFLVDHWDESATQNACDLIAKDAGAESLSAWVGSDNAEAAQRQVVAEVFRLMDGDIKATGLKELQGLIWRQGYTSGQLCSHVYEDVSAALKAWNKLGMRVCIYSSGSVTAQKLFFAHTEQGDLTGHFQGHYDTTTGPKKQADSYTAIAQDMRLAAHTILFISDVVAELDAAASAGMMTALAVRPGNAPIEGKHSHPVIRAFAEISVTR